MLCAVQYSCPSGADCQNSEPGWRRGIEDGSTPLPGAVVGVDGRERKVDGILENSRADFLELFRYHRDVGGSALISPLKPSYMYVCIHIHSC